MYYPVGGLEPIYNFYDFPIILGGDETDELIFFRGVETTNQTIMMNNND